ncbi:MAG: UDP-N-acetylglucosamine 1-carboxyvinyltransferase [Synergistetes bacterium]|nr:UDP-N-acetylglucosamine 1-carboxyvinyltransferase [Synergistota bacterium]MCX8127933.1 UDP-N-acetylglucosamine 1-carboxyvinyltransferase [Synergistota bacterium]MDW8192026.1 UDP-N-acetylglucosamine 1-carboxyvinyltransferase [Synergistota bacterium]
MSKIIVEGGVPLNGVLKVQGAKNAALPLMAASILLEDKEKLSLNNVPSLKDVSTMAEILSFIGFSVSMEGDTLIISNTGEIREDVPYELMRKMRASILILGPLLSKKGRVTLPMPGGCPIGTRPIDLHLKGFSLMGAEISIKHGYIEAQAKGRLRGARIYLDFPSVGATENIIMAAALAKGTTVIENAAREPEIGNLIDLLGKMGLDIGRDGESTIVINGSESLHGAEVAVIPDRIVAGTYIIAGVISGGKVRVEKINPCHMEALLSKLLESGIDIKQGENWVEASFVKRPRGVRITTLPYPGFPTDLQAQMMSLLSIAEGTSLITETIFENRFMHVPELRRMGANIRVEGGNAIMEGVESLSGAQVVATDLRAGAALVLAGLSAKGVTIVSKAEHVDRGYEKFVENLKLLGAKIEREED